MVEREPVQAAEADLELLRRQELESVEQLQLSSQRQSRRISEVDLLRLRPGESSGDGCPRQMAALDGTSNHGAGHEVEADLKGANKFIDFQIIFFSKFFL